MPWLVRSSILAATIIVALFIVWSATTRSTEVSVAAGWIKPSGNIQAVQHLEGGIVTEILVDEGDIVEQGQTLLKLEPAAVGSDLALVTGRHRALTYRAERLHAFIEGRASTRRPNEPSSISCNSSAGNRACTTGSTNAPRIRASTSPCSNPSWTRAVAWRQRA